MKKIWIALLVAVLCLSVVPAWAMETNIYRFSNKKVVVETFDTYRTGDASVDVTWSGKPNGNGVFYDIFLRHCPNGESTCTSDYDLWCYTNSLAWTTAEMQCSISLAPAGIYQVQFSAMGGTKASGTITVTAETDP